METQWWTGLRKKGPEREAKTRIRMGVKSSARPLKLLRIQDEQQYPRHNVPEQHS